MFSASPEWTDRDCSIPRYRERERERERERQRSCTPTYSHSNAQGERRRWGQIHYNNPRGCRGPHHSAAAVRGRRWTEQEKLSKEKTPEDSLRSEMCFCLHSNTQTAAATRGTTRSNKAKREGSWEGVVTLTLSAKEKKKVREGRKHECFQEQC